MRIWFVGGYASCAQQENGQRDELERFEEFFDEHFPGMGRRAAHASEIDSARLSHSTSGSLHSVSWNAIREWLRRVDWKFEQFLRERNRFDRSFQNSTLVAPATPRGGLLADSWANVCQSCEVIDEYRHSPASPHGTCFAPRTVRLSPFCEDVTALTNPL